MTSSFAAPAARGMRRALVFSSARPNRRASPRIKTWRPLSSAASPEQDNSTATELKFQSENVKELFQRITSTCSKEDAQELSRIINEDIFGRPFRKNEFYYRGFGGRRAGKKSAAETEAAPAVEVKTTVDLKLTGFEAKSKIKVIKEVRSIAGLGLKEAKELVEGAPKVIQKDLKPEAAEELKAKLEAVGATIELD